MNGPVSGGWKETTDAASGRPYYWNTQTSKTSWIKPDELLTPAQLNTGWTQTSTAEGKIYWYNKSNKQETSWSPPQGWNDAVTNNDDTAIVSSNFNYAARDQPSRDLPPRDDYRRDRSYDQGGYRGPVASTPNAFQNASDEEREAAFNKLLKKIGVQPDWTWEQAIRAGVQDPAFRAIPDFTDRREAFERFQDDMKRESAENEQKRIAKLREDFRAMLQRHPEVKWYSRWKSIKPIVESEAVFRSTDNDDERKQFFDEYVADLKTEYHEKRFQDHESAIKDLGGIMREVNIGPDTRWDQAQQLLNNSPAFMDERFETLTRSEILETFIAQVRKLWNDVNTIKQRNKQLGAREARKAREGFVQLLRELHAADLLNADSSWQTIYPHISEEPRFTALIKNVRTGNKATDGSSPLDLFFDTLDDLDRELRDLTIEAEDVIRATRAKLNPKSTIDDVRAALSQSKRFSDIGSNKMSLLYERLMVALAASFEDAAAAEERHARKKAIEALRSRIKSLDPPMTAEDTWEIIRPRIERLEEYAALEKEEDRKAAFEKQRSRLIDDSGREHRARDRHRDRRHGDKDDRHRSHRERDRDERDRGDRKRSGTPSVVSEGDAYAEDRRRATEQRERQYRASGGSANGLGPPPREHRRRDDDRYRKGSLDDPPRRRDDRDERYERERHDRERRDREVDRERTYVSRADPYSSRGGALDYGDEDGDASSRKRSGSDAVVRNGKRAKLDDEAKKVVEEEKALQSGSEEGEIEEV